MVLDPLARLPEPGEEFSLEEYLTSARKQLMLRALEMTDGNQSAAARLLGISPSGSPQVPDEKTVSDLAEPVKYEAE